MVTLPVKTREFVLKKATGLRKGAVEGGVVLVSDELDSPRVCNMVYMVLAQKIFAWWEQNKLKRRYLRTTLKVFTTILVQF